MGIKFQSTDAHRNMDNLTAQQAMKWAEIANKHYERLSQVDARVQYCKQRAANLANREVIRKYGSR